MTSLIVASLAIVLGSSPAPAQAAGAVQQLPESSKSRPCTPADDETNSPVTTAKQEKLLTPRKKVLPTPPLVKTLPPNSRPELREWLPQGAVPADNLVSSMARLGAIFRQMQTAEARAPRDIRNMRSLATGAREQLHTVGQKTDRIAERFAQAEQNAATRSGQEMAQDLRLELLDILRRLDAQDRMGNFEMQDLMSRFNQAEATASAVQKRAADVEASLLEKIG